MAVGEKREFGEPRRKRSPPLHGDLIYFPRGPPKPCEYGGGSACAPWGGRVRSPLRGLSPAAGQEGLGGGRGCPGAVPAPARSCDTRGAPADLLVAVWGGGVGSSGCLQGAVPGDPRGRALIGSEKRVKVALSPLFHGKKNILGMAGG